MQASHCPVTVAVRIRPAVVASSLDTSVASCISAVRSDASGRESNEQHELLATNPKEHCAVRDHTFAFDKILDSAGLIGGAKASQKDIYDSVGIEIVRNAMTGYNACLFAYGQTGSGKTFTMIGLPEEEQKGVAVRICEGLFVEMLLKEGWQFGVEIRYLEIYNEGVYDLLLTHRSSSRESLKVREDPTSGPFVEGLTTRSVSCIEEVVSLVQEASVLRTTAATAMNRTSSRSHCIIQLTILQQKCSSSPQRSGGPIHTSTLSSKVNLVDLAGSERVALTNTEAFARRQHDQLVSHISGHCHASSC